MIDYKTLLANYLRGCPKSLVFRGRIAIRPYSNTQKQLIINKIKFKLSIIYTSKSSVLDFRTAP